VGLPEVEEIMTLAFFVLTQYRRTIATVLMRGVHCAVLC